MEVQIRRLSGVDDSSECLLSRQVFDSLNLSEGLQYKIHAGQSTQLACLKVDNSSKESIFFPDNVFEGLLIPEDLTLNIKAEGRDIYLGPVIGKFLNYNYYPDFENENMQIFDASAAIEEKCLFYYFSIYDIFWEDNRIRGYTRSPQTGKWIWSWFPFPDVIYDRGVHFKAEEKPLVKEARKRFKENPRISFINNADYLGKWETYKELSKYPEMVPYLPKTDRYFSFNDVIKMLKRHDFIFLKSFYGSGGKQVLSIQREGEEYRLVFYSGGLKDIVVKDIDELRNQVEEFTEGNKFIIQEGIKLMKYDNRNFDMRVLIIKDLKGKWRVIYNWVRIAKSNFTITNTSAGGDGDYFEKIFPNLKCPLCNGKILDYKDIEEATLKIAECLDKAMGSFGEIGMDIAIDIYGKIWFIEGNTKPDRDLDPRYDDMKKIPLQAYAIFEYSKYLAKF